MNLRYSWLLVVALALTTGATCNNQSNENGGGAVSARPRVKLPGVDTSSLTAREHRDWSEHVSVLLSPCKEVAVSVAQCVREKRKCSLCVPAAKFLLRHVQAGRPKKQITQVYGDRFQPDKIKEVVIGGAPGKGPKDAAVTIVEFADFECGACGAAYPIVERAYDKFKGKIRFVFKHFPLSSHTHARLAAQAAFAAQKQGQFWRMHALLFKNQLQLTEPDLIKYAKGAGLDVDKFKADMHSKEAQQRVEQDKQQGERLGVDATPTIYINGRSCDLTLLANPQTELENWIQLELGRGETKPPPVKTASPSATASASVAPSSQPRAGSASANPTRPSPTSTASAAASSKPTALPPTSP